MASFFSLLPDILPMIIRPDVAITKGADLEAQAAAKEDVGMVRQGAVIGKSDRMCASVLRAKPHCSSAVHHHGEQDTIIYAASGRGVLVTNPGDKDDGDDDGEGGELGPGPGSGSRSSPEHQLKREELAPGDFAFIPPWTEHQEINEGDEELVWVLIRSGPEPVVVYLTGWDGDEVRSDDDDDDSESTADRSEEGSEEEEDVRSPR